MGRFLTPFEDTRASEGTDACRTDADGRKLCKPAGATWLAAATAAWPTVGAKPELATATVSAGQP